MLYDSSIWYLYTAHALIKQINTDQLNTIIEFLSYLWKFEPIQPKYLKFLLIACRLTYIPLQAVLS